MRQKQIHFYRQNIAVLTALRAEHVRLKAVPLVDIRTDGAPDYAEAESFIA
ncbi:MAG: hypothetical protein IJK89_13685 [Clostridia bacterium]|nr:hypothetical protein [Clostridia bacterium]